MIKMIKVVFLVCFILHDVLCIEPEAASDRYEINLKCQFLNLFV